MSLLLSDFGLIGNRASAALVSRLGSIDWCCMPYLDSPSHFASILDPNQGGKFQICPQGDFRSRQMYKHSSHVLETLFETAHGRATLTDWMPLGPSQGDPVIFRKIEVLDGRVPWLVACTPRFAYGSHAAQAESHRGGILFRGNHEGELAQLRGDADLDIAGTGGSAVARFTLAAGESRTFAWAWGRRETMPEVPGVNEALDVWRSFAHRCPPDGCPFAGPWHDTLARAALTLKILSTTYGGSLAEAVTTSLPGVSGASQTWDYRFAWVRDCAMAMQALTGLGFNREAELMFNFLTDVVVRDGAEGLQPVYTLDGGKSLPERELGHLAGYRGSRPVRIGNQASRQFQLDIYGHVMLAASERRRAGHELPEALWARLFEIADYVCQAWRRPDQGPWETRSRPEHFVASKLMCWAALDRAISLSRSEGRTVPARWTEERKILHRTICEQGYDPAIRSFVRAFGSRELDSATLLVALLGFLPSDDPRVRGTLDAIQTQLSDGVLLYRYRGGEGVPSGEGAHLVSSFQFVSCLALTGRVDEASDRLAELCTHATPLGLFGEQVDVHTGETTGNFPSAAVHLAMINAGLYVGAARGRRVPLSHLIGMDFGVAA